MSSQSWPRSRRLRKRREFQRVQNGPNARGSTPILLVLGKPRDGDRGPCRVGFVVSRKVGGAVVRNRVKRRMREVVRRQGDLPFGMDLVLVARPRIATALLSQIEQAFTRALAGLRRGGLGKAGQKSAGRPDGKANLR